jgi:hypothetical protein
MRFPLSLSLLLALSAPALAQQPVGQDGPAHSFQDSLMTQLVGQWTMSGDLLGSAAPFTLRVEWVLNHQFLRLEMRDQANPPKYEAISYVGYDNASERYVAHWIDIFGGRWSETLGYGKREGNSVRFVFEYPDGPFVSVYTFDPKTGWRIDMTQRATTGGWKDFAHYKLVKHY